MLVIHSRQPIEPGCFIDGHHGHYVLPMSIRLAMRHGYRPAFPGVESLVERYDMDWHEFSPQDFVDLTEASDDALEYLTGITEGGYWEWVDGELFLTADDEAEAP